MSVKAPPKALDDEEISFIRQLETKKLDSDMQRKKQQEHDRAAFCKLMLRT